MKKLLPTSTSFSVNKTKGFTLVELLVVIAILAVLAIIGFAVFQGLTGRGNDARRRADVKSISDAMEVARGNNPTYQPITNNSFTGGVPPTEPTNRTERYCYQDGTAAIPNPVAWTGSACPAGWQNVDGVLPAVAGCGAGACTATFYKVCTVDQNTPANVICFGSRQ